MNEGKKARCIFVWIIVSTSIHVFFDGQLAFFYLFTSRSLSLSLSLNLLLAFLLSWATSLSIHFNHLRWGRWCDFLVDMSTPTSLKPFDVVICRTICTPIEWPIIYHLIQMHSNTIRTWKWNKSFLFFSLRHFFFSLSLFIQFRIHVAQCQQQFLLKQFHPLCSRRKHMRNYYQTIWG